MLTRTDQHKALCLLFTSFGLLTIVFSLSLPLGEAADERDHFTLVRFIAEEGRIPATLAERTALGEKGDASPIYHSLVALLSQHTDIAALPDLPLQLNPIRYIPDDMPSTNIVYHTEDELFPFRGIVLAWHLGRLVSIPLGLLTLLGIYLTTLAIYPQRPYFAIAVTGFAAFVPRFVINSSVINDDNLAVPLITFSIYCLTRVIQGRRRYFDFLLLGSLIGLATIVKYHALVLLLETSLVLLWFVWREKNTWWQFWRNIIWLMAGFLISAGWWFFFLWSHFNQVTELGWWAGLLAPLGDPTIATGSQNLLQGGRTIYWTAWIQPLFETFWFVYGGTQILASPAVYHGLAGISIIAGIGVILWLLVRDKQTEPDETEWPLAIWLLGLHLVIYLCLIFIRFQINPTILAAQGRHLFAALISLSFFMVLGWRYLGQILWHFIQHRRMDVYLAWIISACLVCLNFIILSVFIHPVYRPYLPIMRQLPTALPLTAYFEQELAAGIDFVGYRIEHPPSVGHLLPITLFWQATAEPRFDYLVSLCLYDQHDIKVVCHRGYPAEGRYPTRAWEAGYLVRDQISLALPKCLIPDDYTLKLNLVPLRDDKAEVKLDQTRYRSKPLILGEIAIANARPKLDWTNKASLKLCHRDECNRAGRLDLKHIRQSLALQITQPLRRIGDRAYLIPDPYFQLINPGSENQWHPLPFVTVYDCGDDQVISTYNFILDPTISSGTYQLIEPNTSPRLSLEIDVPQNRNFTLPKALQTKSALVFGDGLSLIGYELTPKTHAPGETVEVILYWEALKTQRQPLYSSLHLLDADMLMWAQHDQLLGGPYLNMLWTPGEVIREVHHIHLGPNIPPGLHQLELGVYAYEQNTFAHLPIHSRVTRQPLSQKPILAQVRVLNAKHQQQPTHNLRVKLGSAITLTGYDLSGDLTHDKALQLSLYWLNTEAIEMNYTVFTQLIGPDGQVWAQQDNQPQQGRYPTSAWQIGEQVIDDYELILRDGAPFGDYQLYVGMYDLSTGKRLDAIPLIGFRRPDQAIFLKDFSRLY